MNVRSVKCEASADQNPFFSNAMKTKTVSLSASPPTSKLLAAGLLAFTFSVQGLAHATDIAHLKLTGHWDTANAGSFPGVGYHLGDDGATPPGPNTLASNENWIVAGAPQAKTVGSIPPVQGGAVQVFNAVTGLQAYELVPPLVPPVVVNTRYGTACAVSGNVVVVGAPGPVGSSPGVAYVYKIGTGLPVLWQTLHPSNGVVGDSFGSAVAISGNWVIVGSPNAAGGQGSAYVFNLATGVQLGLPIPDPATTPLTTDAFGFSIAAEGNVAIISAPGVDTAKGAVFAYDLSTTLSPSPPYLIKEFQPSASVAGDQAGWSVAMHQGQMILGAPGANTGFGAIYVMGMLDGVENTLTGSDVGAGEGLGRCVATHQGLVIAGSPFQASNRGAIYLYDLNALNATTPPGTEFQKLIPPDGGTTRFGLTVAIFGNQAAITAPDDNTQSAGAGAVYLMSPVQRPMPLTKVTAKGDFAPGANESNFGLIGDAFVSPLGEVALSSHTASAGPAWFGVLDVGIWNTLAPGQPLDLVLKSHNIDNGLLLGTVYNPLANFSASGSSLSVFQGIFSHLLGGVTSLTDQAIYTDNGVTLTRILRTGDPTAFASVGPPGATPMSFGTAVQSQNVDRVATICKLTGGTSATNDSGLLWHPITGIEEAQREGQPAPGTSGLNYGEFLRVASYWDNVVYATAITGPVATNQAVFQKVFGGAITKVVQKGDAAIPNNVGGAHYTALLGESSDDGEWVLFHATLGPPAVVGVNNDGLWLYSPGPTYSLVARTGDQVFSLPTGAKIASFINYWQTAGSTLALVTLKIGSGGVLPANNHALIAFSNLGNIPPVVLMRTGDPAPGCGAATISAINGVQIESKNAHYLVLASLAAPTVPALTPAENTVFSTMNVALFRGFANKPIGSDPYALTFRHPVPVLRKGQLFLNQCGKISSIALPTTNFAPASGGAGNTGLGVIMSRSVDASTPNTVVIPVDFVGGVHQVMKGIP